MVRLWRRWTVVLLASMVAAGAWPAAGQPEPGAPPSPGGSHFGADAAETKDVVAIHAEFTAPAGATPARLFVSATIKPGWRVYSVTQPPGGPIATKIEVSPKSGVKLLDVFRPLKPPDTKKEPLFDNITVETHHGTVIWYAPIELPAGVHPSEWEIPGTIAVQACDANFCLPPKAMKFTARLTDHVPQPSLAAPTAVTAHEVPAAGPAVFDPNALQIAENDQLRQTPMALVVLTGFLGGLILNLMPCVLPVIGLKILSFLEQSGHSRGHALALNIWYSLGLLSVFLVLATLAVTPGLTLGWGQLFSYSVFNVTLAAVVFVMGLSFLGVWEVPIPGFVGRGTAVELAEKEGFAGAFSKGVLTTILATPCSARFSRRR